MLILDAALILIYPLPDALQEGFAANLVTIGTLLRQQSLNDGLCGDAGVIFCRDAA